MASLEPSSTPKLSLFSLPNQISEPPGMLTPPLQSRASVPFLWEEAPGKSLFPSSAAATTTPTTLVRCLELPPRLHLPTEAKITEIPSPTTVLDGPYVRRSSSHSTVFARERLASFEEFGSVSKKRECRGSGYFNSMWGRKSSKRNTRVCEDSCVISPCSSSLSCGDSGFNTKVKITRIKRTGSFFNLSSSRSHTHFLASIYGTFKHVVPLPWRSKKTNKDGHSIV